MVADSTVAVDTDVVVDDDYNHDCRNHWVVDFADDVDDDDDVKYHWSNDELDSLVVVMLPKAANILSVVDFFFCVLKSIQVRVEWERRKGFIFLFFFFGDILCMQKNQAK